MRTRVVALCGVALVALGCENSEPSGPSQPITAAEAQLKRVESCDELESHIKSAAIDEMRVALEQARDSYRYGYYGYAEDGDIAAPSANSEGSSGRNNSGSSAGQPEHSNTNTQEQDVDEADLVKTDGHFVYTVTASHLVIIKSFPASEMEEVSRLRLGGSPTELFLAGDRLVVFGSVWGDDVPEPLRKPVEGGGGGIGRGVDIVCPADGNCGGYNQVLTRIAIIDVSNRAVPKVTREIFTEGSYVTSRMIDSSVRVALSAYMQGPVLNYWPNISPRYDIPILNSVDQLAVDREFAKLAAENEAIINATTLEDWLPKGLDVTHDGGTTTSKLDFIADCDDFYHPTRGTGRGLIDLLTYYVGESPEDDSVDHATIVSEAGVVYASSDALYVATHPWYSTWGWWRTFSNAWEQQQQSLIHKFDIGTDERAARYVASGSVPGHVLNQFAMDEHDGHLRVATTIDPVWGTEGMISDTSNHLFVLKSRNGALDVVGEVRDLAPGERVYSARFEGNVGFVVTFRQVDPLFAFDLTDPTTPKVKSELKITGFSTYMHPLERAADGTPTYLLTIGQSADEQGRVDGMQLSIFDVRNLDEVRLVHRAPIDTDGGWAYSDALYNHKAFAYFPEHQLLAIPVTSWQTGFMGARVFRVDVEDGITKVADIQHDAYYSVDDQKYFGYDGWAQILRAFTIEDGGDPSDPDYAGAYLYTLSGRALVASPLDNLGDPSTFFSVDELPQPVYDVYYYY